MTRFDYIITFHNKEDLVERVIFSLLACLRNDSHIYAVLDGCTDQTEAKLDKIAADYKNLPITKVYTPDVHEIRAINTALGLIPLDDDGYVITLQDDVLLADYRFEEKIMKVYQHYGSKLGYLTFRLAANLDGVEAPRAIQEVDLVENDYSSHGLKVRKAKEGEIVFREAAIKSPGCYPKFLLRKIGFLNEDLAPYGWDDHDFSIRSYLAGYQNAMLPIKFISDVDWGSFRRTPDPKIDELYNRNTQIIRKKYPDFFSAKHDRNRSIDRLDLGSRPGDYEGVSGQSPTSSRGAIGRLKKLLSK